MALAAILLPAPCHARLGPADYRLPPFERGAQRDYIRDMTALGPVIRQEIFDGDRWWPLTSEQGWQLFIEIQHEENPDALE